MKAASRKCLLTIIGLQSRKCREKALTYLKSKINRRGIEKCWPTAASKIGGVSKCLHHNQQREKLKKWNNTAGNHRYRKPEIIEIIKKENQRHIGYISGEENVTSIGIDTIERHINQTNRKENGREGRRRNTYQRRKSERKKEIPIISEKSGEENETSARQNQ